VADLRSWLASLMGDDPEGEGAAQASSAMEPAIEGYGRDVASGDYLQKGLASLMGSYGWDPEMSPRENAVAMAKDPSQLDTATNVAMGVGPGAIRAYHGSPHSFDRFDSSKIGSGEGGQAYGTGLYFAEHEPVARSYRDGLSQTAIQIGDQKLVPARGSPEYIALAHLENAADMQSSAPYASALKTLRSGYEAVPDTPTGTARKDMENAIRVLGEWQDKGAKLTPAGSMYEVNINADPQRFLDWDKPLNAQPEILDRLSGSRRKAVRGMLSSLPYQEPTRTSYGVDIGPVTGNTLYSGLSFDLTGRPYSRQASEALRAADIPGIRYLDQSSRVVPGQISINRKIMNDPSVSQAMRDQAKVDLAKWESENTTSNFVTFPGNDHLIEILRKYGLLGTLGAGTAAAANPYAGIMQGGEQ
jgi:hypothetical protein